MNDVMVIIDPGHGSDTPGKRSPKTKNGEIFYEYQFNRSVANKLKSLLDANNIDTMLTVNDDKDLRLSERAQIAIEYAKSNPNKSCIFISIHSNAAGSDGKWKNAKGWSVYTTKGNTESDVLAESLYKAADTCFTDRKIRKEKSDGDPDYESDFTVIYLTDKYMPAVLVENFFYDNEEECEFLLKEENQERIAQCLFIGITYFIANKIIKKIEGFNDC